MSHQEDLKAYLDGELSVSEVSSLEKALRSDPKLAAELEDLRSVTKLVRSIREPVPHGLEATLWKLEKLSAKPKAKPLWGNWLAVGAVGACAMIFALVVLFPAAPGISTQNEAKAVATLGVTERSRSASDPTADFSKPSSESLAKPKEARNDSLAFKNKSLNLDREKIVVAPRSPGQYGSGINGQAKIIDTPAPAASAKRSDPTIEPKSDKSPTALEDTKGEAQKARVGDRATNTPSPDVTVGVRLAAKSAPAPSRQLVTPSIDRTKAELVTLVHLFKGTISLGQPKGSPLTATITISEENVDEFNASVQQISQRYRRAQMDSSARVGFGGGGSGGLGASAAQSAPSERSVDANRRDEKTSVKRQPQKSFKAKRTLSIQLIPMKE